MKKENRDKEVLLKKLGHRIKSIREKKNISQQMVAAKCNFEKSNMSRIEAGRTNPTVYTLYKISNALEVKLSYLVDYE